MEVTGYCTIKKDATTGTGAKSYESFIGKDLRVMEFTSDGAVLVINSEGNALAMFEKQDVYRKFECRIMGEFIMPPELDTLQQMEYMGRCMARKGGYGPLLRSMVIQASLMRGKFTDSFLWQTPENTPQHVAPE